MSLRHDCLPFRQINTLNSSAAALDDSLAERWDGLLLMNSHFRELLIPSQQGSQSSGAALFRIFDTQIGQGPPIGLEERTRGLGYAQTALSTLVTVRKEGGDDAVGNIRQGEVR